MINPEIFRGYDIRGISGTDLTDDTYYLLGLAYGSYLAKRRIELCPVGRDNRPDSDDFSHSFIRGLNESGINTIDLGLSLTQIVYFSSYYFDTKACAMITASHNPKEYNGLKLGTGYSETMLGPDLQQLRKMIDEKKYTHGQAGNKRADIFSAYTSQLLRHFHLKKRWKVVVDCCTSSSGLFYPKILSKAGCRVITQNTRPDSHFPLGTPDPTDEKVLDRLAKRVIKEKADLGLAYDADGDRMAVVDENGHTHWMDIVFSLFSIDVLEFMPGSTIIYNTLCSKTVPETITRFGGTPVMWKTGHSFIKAKMKESGAVLGGELSGHIFFDDNYFGHDDAAYASLRLLSFLEEHHQSLSQAVQAISTRIGSPEIKLGAPDETKFDLVSKKIKPKLLKAWPKAKTSERDGIRLDTPEVMVVVRASQNGPYITIRFEAADSTAYNKVRQKIKHILKTFPSINWKTGVNISAIR